MSRWLKLQIPVPFSLQRYCILTHIPPNYSDFWWKFNNVYTAKKNTETALRWLHYAKLSPMFNLNTTWTYSSTIYWFNNPKWGGSSSYLLLLAVAVVKSPGTMVYLLSCFTLLSKGSALHYGYSNVLLATVCCEGCKTICPHGKLWPGD